MSHGHYDLAFGQNLHTAGILGTPRTQRSQAEVISPSIANYDRKTKSDTYRAMVVREMWLIDNEKKEVEVRSFETDKTTIYSFGDTLQSEVLPKIEPQVSALFT
jgi:Uma2 family endonuclease